MWIALLALLAVPQEQGSGFDFTPPPGWTKTEDAKVTYLGPPGTASKQVQVAIYPAAEDASATAQSLHDRAFKMFVERAARHEEPATDRLGAFLSSRTKLTQANGEPAWLAVYTIKSGIDVGWI